MAKFISKVPMDQLKDKLHSKKRAGSNFGFGLGGNDITSRPQTIDEQAPLEDQITMEKPSIEPISNNPVSTGLSEEQLLKLLEEA